MEKNRMKVLVFEPGQEPHVEIINKNESAYRELVGGPITAKPLDDNTVIVYNDIKSEENATPNRWVGGAIISGTFFLASSRPIFSAAPPSPSFVETPIINGRLLRRCAFAANVTDVSAIE